jgi:predicted AlkP superfamily pyrophosphatase or phosphodiesterase/predicted Na+-dependent transporter
MGPIVDLLIPAVLVLLMFVVGLGLTLDDFRRLRDLAHVVVLATLGQAILLPVLAVGLAWGFEPGPKIAIGMVLVAACPGGALSNFYSHLSGANVALSVTLTSVASLTSLVTLPLAVALGLSLLAVGGSRIPVPVTRIFLQLFLLVLLPIVLGMLARRRWPTRMVRVLPKLNGVSVLAIIALLVVIFADQAGALIAELPKLVGLAIAFTVLAFGVGAGLARLLGQGRPELTAIGMEFSVRNLAVMALVAVAAFGEPEYLLFGAIFVVVQTPLMLVAAAVFRLGERGTVARRGVTTMVLLAVMMGGASQPVAGAADPAEPILILVSLDGFRWDYLDLVETPSLRRLSAGGVRAEGLIPVFPSKTFPSHYSIVTGLYPGNHGIISNNMIDSRMRGEFHLSDREAVEDPRWWGGEPIWVTAEKQGVTAATLFWPGSETAVAGIRPTYWKRFDRSLTFDRRVEEALRWMDLPSAERPRMITLYFEYPNDVSHDYGPESPEAFAAVREVDARVGDLVAGIEARGLSSVVNVVIVSDHGMAEVGPERTIFLDDHVDLEPGEVFEQGALLQVYPRPGRKKKLYEALSQVSENLTIYRRKDIPKRYHLQNNSRTPPILGVPDVGWEVATREVYAAEERALLKGDHGQDPSDPRMHGIFIAHGPAFRSGLVIDRFECVEIYNVLAAVLDLEPAPNDGTAGRLDHILDDTAAASVPGT